MGGPGRFRSRPGCGGLGRAHAISRKHAVRRETQRSGNLCECGVSLGGSGGAGLLDTVAAGNASRSDSGAALRMIFRSWRPEV